MWIFKLTSFLICSLFNIDIFKLTLSVITLIISIFRRLFFYLHCRWLKQIKNFRRQQFFSFLFYFCWHFKMTTVSLNGGGVKFDFRFVKISRAGQSNYFNQNFGPPTPLVSWGYFYQHFIKFVTETLNFMLLY